MLVVQLHSVSGPPKMIFSTIPPPGETCSFDVVWDDRKGKSSAANVCGNGDGVPSQKGKNASSVLRTRYQERSLVWMFRSLGTASLSTGFRSKTSQKKIVIGWRGGFFVAVVSIKMTNNGKSQKLREFEFLSGPCCGRTERRT